jgi:hypothetical protein
MATIIKFYKPQSFREGSRAAPPERFGKVLQFPTSHTENELTPIPLRFDSDKHHAAHRDRTRRLFRRGSLAPAQYVDMQSVDRELTSF